MFRSVLARGWTPSLIAAFSAAGRTSRPLRVEHVHAAARAEAGDDVADGVDEQVADVQRPGRVRELLEDVAFGPLSTFETWKALASSQTRCHFSSIALASYLSITVHRSEEQKSLSRERLHETPTALAALVPDLCKKPDHD